METDKLIEIIRLQSQIIELLSRDYNNANRSPIEKEFMRELIRELKDLEKDLV